MRELEAYRRDRAIGFARGEEAAALGIAVGNRRDDRAHLVDQAVLQE